MAVVVDSKKEVVKYFEENGADIAGMSEEEIINQAEVFPLKKDWQIFNCRSLITWRT